MVDNWFINSLHASIFGCPFRTPVKPRLEYDGPIAWLCNGQSRYAVVQARNDNDDDDVCCVTVMRLSVGD